MLTKLLLQWNPVRRLTLSAMRELTDSIRRGEPLACFDPEVAATLENLVAAANKVNAAMRKDISKLEAKKPKTSKVSASATKTHEPRKRRPSSSWTVTRVEDMAGFVNPTIYQVAKRMLLRGESVATVSKKLLVSEEALERLEQRISKVANKTGSQFVLEVEQNKRATTKAAKKADEPSPRQVASNAQPKPTTHQPLPKMAVASASIIEREQVKL